MNHTTREFFLAAARHNARAALLASPPSSPSPGARRGRKRTPYILIVEDDADIADLVKQELADCGYRVRTAHHGGEALDILKEEFMRPQHAGDPPCLPQLIMVDVHMPVMNGIEFLRTLARSYPQFDSVPILAMSDSQSVTEFTRWAVQVEGLNEDQVGALAKPFSNLAVLVEKVAERAGLPPSDPDKNDEGDDDPTPPGGS